MTGRKLARELERRLGESVEKPETGGRADGGGQPACGLGDVVVADRGDLGEIRLKPFDERS